MLGCDGIYDRLTSVDVVDAAWSAMAAALKQHQKVDIHKHHRSALTIHQITGKMADTILKLSAQEKSYDNLTVVIVSFKNLENFYEYKKRLPEKVSQAIKIEGENESYRNHNEEPPLQSMRRDQNKKKDDPNTN